ncbi:hypothetical protein HZS_4786, partial [Henneguya salminicola]
NIIFLIICPNICDHFVCGIIPSETLKLGLKFKRKNTHCLIPAFSKRKNLRVSAPTFMCCDMDKSGNKSVKIVATNISIATKMCVKMEKTCQIVKTEYATI